MFMLRFTIYHSQFSYCNSIKNIRIRRYIGKKDKYFDLKSLFDLIFIRMHFHFSLFPIDSLHLYVQLHC